MPDALGKLVKKAAKHLWDHEEYDFTPWLAKEENIAELGRAIGLELVVDRVEKVVGPYSADITAKDVGSDRDVVIENQFGKTNHDHLGKILTYASLLDATAVVWISETFTEEHRKALDWLNEHTADLAFYGVAVELWQIDDSKPAVRFHVVSRPNSAVRTASVWKNAGDLSPTRRLQLEFWTAFSQKLIREKVIASTQTPRPQHSFDVVLGRSHVWLCNIVKPAEHRVGVQVYLNHRIATAALSELESQREAIETELHEKLEWNPNPENLDKVIGLYREVNMDDRARWDEYLTWMVEKVRDFRRVFGPRVKAIDWRLEADRRARPSSD